MKMFNVNRPNGENLCACYYHAMLEKYRRESVRVTPMPIGAEALSLQCYRDGEWWSECVGEFAIWYDHIHSLEMRIVRDGLILWREAICVDQFCDIDEFCDAVQKLTDLCVDQYDPILRNEVFITVGGPTAGEVGWCHPESVVASYTRFDYAFGGD